MPARQYNPGSYRFGFNGQEKDDEISGVNGANTTAEFWEYDSRLGRRWNIDPVVKYWESPYACFNDNPIQFSDPKGNVPGGTGVKQLDVEISGEGAGIEAEEEENAALRMTVGKVTGNNEGGGGPMNNGGAAKLKVETQSEQARKPVKVDSKPQITTTNSKELKQKLIENSATQEEKAVLKTGEKIIDPPKAIGPAGDAAGQVFKQIPKDWEMTTSNKGNGTVFKDPKNPGGNNVRVMGGNKNSPNPAQKNPYVKQVKNGKQIDVNGKPTTSKSPDAHIPKENFKMH